MTVASSVLCVCVCVSSCKYKGLLGCLVCVSSWKYRGHLSKGVVAFVKDHFIAHGISISAPAPPIDYT